MIANVNYKGSLAPGELCKVSFNNCRTPPHQQIFPLDGNLKLLVFTSGKCRLMGARGPLTKDLVEQLPLKVLNLRVQSVTLVDHIGCDINLIRLARALPRKSFLFEPELFPAVRLTIFNPLCVNVFATGKVVILGAKKLTNRNLVRRIKRFLNTYINKDDASKLSLFHNEHTCDSSTSSTAL